MDVILNDRSFSLTPPPTSHPSRYTVDHYEWRHMHEDTFCPGVDFTKRYTIQFKMSCQHHANLSVGNVWAWIREANTNWTDSVEGGGGVLQLASVLCHNFVPGTFEFPPFFFLEKQGLEKVDSHHIESFSRHSVF